MADAQLGYLQSLAIDVYTKSLTHWTSTVKTVARLKKWNLTRQNSAKRVLPKVTSVRKLACRGMTSKVN